MNATSAPRTVGVGEQPHVQHRRRGAQLAQHEPDPERHAGDHGQHRDGDGFLPGNGLDAIDERQQRQQQQHHADQVKPASMLVAVLRQQQRRSDHHDRHHRHGHQERRPPREHLQQQPAEQRAERHTRGDAGGPNTDRDPALLGIQEHRVDQAERGRHLGGGRDAEDRPPHDHHGRIVGVGGDHRDHPEHGRADDQQPAPADPVAEGTHGDQQPGHQEPVDVQNPQHLRAAGLQIRCHMRDREEQDRQHHEQQQGWKDQQAKAQPLPASCA
jgi:hypothetical protein